MKAYKDREARYYVDLSEEYPNLPLITRVPRIVFAKSPPRLFTTLTEDDAAWVLVGFLDTAQQIGGDSFAIHHLKEIYMAKSKGVLAVNLAVTPAAIVHMFAFEKEAHEAVKKEGGPFHGLHLIDSDEAFNKLSVAHRCELARPLMNDKEKPTPDGEGLAAVAFKICQRFKNPKPAKGTTEGADAKPKKESAPRAKGVKTLIFEYFRDFADTAHLSVEEIMTQVKGTKASVTTAISDLRSTKYAGSQGTMNLVRVNGKYALEGSKAAAIGAEAQAKADKVAEEAKAAKKAEEAKAKADKKAADEKAAKEKAEKDAKAAEKK